MTKKQKIEITLPECGIFIGSGVYPSAKDYFLSALYAHMAWQGQRDKPLDILDKIISDNQGNLAQYWGVPRGTSPAVVAEWIYALDEIGIIVPEPDFEKGTNIQVSKCQEIKDNADRLGAGAVRFVKEAAKRGIYTAFIYTSATDEWAAKLKDLGNNYLGYDFGERFNFKRDIPGKDPKTLTRKDIGDYLVEQVREHCDERHEKGWGNIMATSSNFCIDYEMLGNADIPLIEDFAFSHLSMSSALSRGLYRQHDLPLWGSHLAHEHYSWIPYSNPCKFPLFRASMYQKYMAGSKIIINESGNWFVEGTLVEDSPKHEFPYVPLRRDEVSWNTEGKDPMVFAPYIEEARKHYHKINYGSDICRQYRKEISDFYDYVKENGTPEGQPESTVAVIKGNYDLSGHRHLPTASAADQSWDAVRAAYYPLHPILGENKNLFLSGTPYGMVDIVSFAQDQITAENLNANYKALVYSGWNTCSDKQYGIIKQYVEAGGTLFISLPHLSTKIALNDMDFTVDDLVNGGDFSDLCGVKVKGKGKHFYWATAPRGTDELGFKFPRRFGVMNGTMGDLEITDPDIDVLIVDDENAFPMLIRRKCGKGTVYFLNSWQYPGEINHDNGPGSTNDSPGMVGMIYRHIANLNRGEVWITDDGQKPGKESEYVSYSYFPKGGEICLLNVDFSNPHAFSLHHNDQEQRIELKPGEFKVIQTR